MAGAKYLSIHHSSFHRELNRIGYQNAFERLGLEYNSPLLEEGGYRNIVFIIAGILANLIIRLGQIVEGKIFHC